MTRTHGPILSLLLLLAVAATRLLGQSRASALVEHEDAARRLVAEVVVASIDSVARGRPHPGLRGDFLARFPQLAPRPDLATGAVSYADDGEYLYALAASLAATDAADGPRQGFVLRAWPLDFGATGDLEFHATEDGRLWEGQNCLGRSGHSIGFPPAFPDADLHSPAAGWIELPGLAADHR